MNHEDFEHAATYWTEKDAETPNEQRMPADELHAAVEDFLTSHDTCALATAGADGSVRCTPLEYLYHHGALWIFSEGGRKFCGLEPAEGADEVRVGLAVYEPYAGFSKLKSLQVEGTARIVDPTSPEFAAAAEAKHIPAARVPKLASMLHLIKVTPVELDYLDSSLKQRGYNTRQHLAW